MTERNEKTTNAIVAATWEGGRAARLMAKRLVDLGATPEEIKDAIEHLEREANSEAKAGLVQREGLKN